MQGTALGAKWGKYGESCIPKLDLDLDLDLDLGPGPNREAPMHLGLTDGPFVPLIKSWEPCCSAKAPDGPQVYTLDILWLQEKGAQVCVSEWGQGFTFTKNVGRGFLFHSTLPA
jgi:hypothetical protein